MFAFSAARARRGQAGRDCSALCWGKRDQPCHSSQRTARRGSSQAAVVCTRHSPLHQNQPRFVKARGKNKEMKAKTCSEQHICCSAPSRARVSIEEMAQRCWHPPSRCPKCCTSFQVAAGLVFKPGNAFCSLLYPYFFFFLE